MKNLLSLAMMGLTVIAFPVHANHKISGSIRLDVQAPFQPDSLPINLFLSRGRIDIKGDLAPDWTYKVRLDSPAMLNPTISPIALLPVAKVTWHTPDSISLNFGLDTPNYSQADTENQTYIDRSLGVLDDSIGNKLGMNANHVFNKTFGYSFGVWRCVARPDIADHSFSAVPLENDDGSIEVADVDSAIATGQTLAVTLGKITNRFAIGGRLNYVLANTPVFKWGAGIGLQSLDVIVPTSVYDPNNFVSTFNKRIALTGDTSFGYKRLCVNTAAHYFNYARDHAVSSPLSALTSGSNGFQHKNYAMSGYIEILGLLVGEKYDIDPSVGVVNKVIYAPNEGALEIALRVGAERYHNFAAANFVKNAFSSVPYTYTKNIGYNAVALTASIDDSFAVGYSGYTIHATYYMNKNILFKTEFYDNKTHLRTASNWTTLETEQGLRLRSEFNF